MKNNKDEKKESVFADYHTRVRYGETDAMKVAYYANYAVWFEAGRGAYGRKTGLLYRDFEEQGFYAVVAELHCRYIKPVRFNDEIIVRTRIEAATSRTMRFSYEVFLAEDMSLRATGYTKHVCISKDGRVSKLPPKWLKLKDTISF